LLLLDDMTLRKRRHLPNRKENLLESRRISRFDGLNFDCARSSETFNCTNIFSTLICLFIIQFYGATRSAHRHNHVCQIFSRSVQGLRSSDTPKLPFPIDLLRRPYKSVRTAVRQEFARLVTDRKDEVFETDNAKSKWNAMKEVWQKATEQACGWT